MSSVEGVASLISRNRAAVAVGVMTAVLSTGTVAAASIVLGGSNTASTTTTISSTVNGPVLTLKNTNSAGGTSAKGLSITVPAGRAPITVSSNAGKATNLDADKLDGKDSTSYGQVREFYRGIPAASAGPLDLISFGGLTLKSTAGIAQNGLVCSFLVSSTANGLYQYSWTSEQGQNTSSLATAISRGTTPGTQSVGVAFNDDQHVGQLLFRNLDTHHTITVAFAFWHVNNADINQQECFWQGTVSAAVP